MEHFRTFLLLDGSHFVLKFVNRPERHAGRFGVEEEGDLSQYVFAIGAGKCLLMQFSVRPGALNSVPRQKRLRAAETA